MDIVKKNMWSIVCGVVAVLAVISTFYPLNGKLLELNGKLQQSVDAERKFKSLINTNPNMPVIDPKSNEVKQLGMFPTEKVIELGRKVVGKVHTESEKLQKTAMDMNKRDPLVPNALPNGAGRFLADFKDEYYHAMAQLRTNMDATTVPTEKDIQDAIQQEWKENFETLIRKVGDVAENEQQVREQFDKVKVDIPKSLRFQRSMQHVMYVNPEKAGAEQGTTNGMSTSFDYHPGIPPLEKGDLPNLIDVWIAQLDYWVQEDVVRSIIESNKGAKNVDEAIIKRLIRIDVKKDYLTKTGPLPINSAMNIANVVAAAQGAQTIDDGLGGPPQKVFGYSATGRVCNTVYDVMHFSITIDADAQRFEAFLNNLTRGKFITILKISLRGVDRELLQQKNFYYYGRQPVVRMEIKCEAIFFRSWTTALMPTNVQKLLRVPQTPTGVAQAK